MRESITLEACAAPDGSVGKRDVSLASRLCVRRTILALDDVTHAANPRCNGFRAASIWSRRRTPKRKTRSSRAVQALVHALTLDSAVENTLKIQVISFEMISERAAATVHRGGRFEFVPTLSSQASFGSQRCGHTSGLSAARSSSTQRRASCSPGVPAPPVAPAPAPAAAPAALLSFTCGRATTQSSGHECRRR